MTKLLNFIVQRPRITLLVVLLVTAYMGYGLTKLETRNNYDSELPADDAIVLTNERLKETFGDKDVVLIAIESDNVFTLGTIGKIFSISEELRKVQNVIDDEIVSLSTVNNIEGRDWGLEVGKFLKTPPTTAEELAQVRNDAVSNEFIHGRLVSEDGTFAVISANVRDGYDQGLVYEQLLQIAQRYENPEKIYLAGDPVQAQAFDIGIQRDIGVLLPLALLLILGGFFFCFRTLRGVALPFSVVVLTIVWTMGLMGHLGLDITVASSGVPLLMVALASSYGIHVVHRYYEEVAAEEKLQGVTRALERISRPVILTGLTSALGSSTLIIFRVNSIREFGIITALGALAAMVLSLTVIPALLALQKKSTLKPGQGKRIDALLLATARFSLHRPGLILGGGVLLLVVFAFGIARIKTGSDFVKYFPSEHSLRQTVEAFNAKMGGARYINIMIEGAEPQAVKSPEFLRGVDAFQEFATSFEGIGHATSFANIVRHINKVMHEGDPAYDKIPETQDLIAQYLLLYSVSGSPGDFDDIVDYDYQRAKVRLMVKTSDQQVHTQLYEAFRDYLASNLATGARGEFGGDVMFWLAEVRYIVTGKIQNMVLVFIVLLLFCTLALRSISAGLLSLVPLLVSTLLTFGMMGFAGLRLDAATAIITAIGVAIGVDFAIHYLIRYREEIGKTGDLVKATEVTALTAGKAILFDVLSNVLGFIVFVFSGFLPVRNFGWLITLMMITVCIGTLIFYPPLFKLLKPRFLWRESQLPDSLGGAELAGVEQ